MTPTRRTLLTAAAGLSFTAAARAQARAPTAAGLAAAAAYSAGSRGVSFLVLDRAGAVLAEEYPNGGAPDRGWELASGTKSFAGVAAAAAVMDGLLRLDERCAETLTEWAGDGRREITLRQLLSLTSGLRGGPVGRPPTYADAVASPAGLPPGARFAYGPTPFQVFGEILRRKLAAAGRPSDPLAYYQRRLFDPIEVRPQSWRRGTDGLPHLPSGAQLTARDWARFGRMVLEGGVVGRRRLVDAGALAANFDGTRANPGYGLTWWLLRPGLIGPAPRAGLNAAAVGETALAEDIVMAAGAGNQRLYLLRARGLVVVRQADGVLDALRGRGPAWSDGAFLGALLG